MVSMTVITLMTRGCIALASGSPHVDVALHLSIEPAPPHFPIFIVVIITTIANITVITTTIIIIITIIIIP